MNTQNTGHFVNPVSGDFTNSPANYSSSSTCYSAVIPFTIAGIVDANLNLAINTTKNSLTGIDFVHDYPMKNPADKISEDVVRQIERYFDDPQWHFDIPLAPEGTGFQKRLWAALCDVPAGSTDTYGQLALQLNSGAQAVGQACRRNPIPIVVPCHRIISQQGMGGYAGETDGEKMTIKKALLAHEEFLGD